MAEEFYKDLYERKFPLPGAAHHALSNDRTRKALSLLNECKPRDILELGFEDPALSRLIIKNSGANYVGVDISEASVKAAKDSGINVIQLDASQEELPFEPDSFDLVLCSEVIEHLYDPDFVVEQFKRVLRPDGKIIITTPNLAAWYNRLLLLTGIQPVHSEVSTRRVLGRRLSILGQGGTPVGHIRLFTLPGLTDFVSLHGLTLLRVRGYSLEFIRRVGFLDRLFSKFPSLASGFIVLLEKKQVHHRPRTIPHSGAI